MNSHISIHDHWVCAER